MNRMEEIKKAKGGLDVLPDLLRYAQEGFEAVPPDDLERFKWYGLYQQRPKEGHFMLRIKLPSGDVRAHQLREIGRLANEYGRGLADLTVRHNFQLHWVRLEDVPMLLNRLAVVGLSTVGACGDNTRTIIGCPLAGLAADEYFDALPVLKLVNSHLTGNREFSNLPRKFKVSISACRLHCAQPDINDVGLYGTQITLDGVNQAGFGLKVGGGLSKRPYFAEDLGVFLRPDEAFRVVHCIAEIFRESDVLREDRSRARLKFLIHDPKIGIGPERFRQLLEEKLGYRLTRAQLPALPQNSELDHLGIHPQKQPGKYYVGIGVSVGRMCGDDLLRIADIAEEFSSEATLRTTNKQNLIVTSIPEERLEALETRLEQARLDYRPSVFKRGLVSCTGIEFCNLAVAETKQRATNLVGELEQRFPGATRQVRIHFSGCPNNCGQTSIADIGLRGGLTKIDGQMVEAFDLLVGGAVGAERAFSQLCSKKIPATQIVDAISALYEGYLGWAKNGESFREFVLAHSLEELDALVRAALGQGEPAPATEA